MEQINKGTQRPYESIRLFKSNYLEFFTHIPPWLPIIFWTPIVSYMFVTGITSNGLGIGETVLTSLAGLLVWTFSEYMLHRYLFHFHAKSKLGQKVVFLFHGIHHDQPQDPTRLLFPPLAGFLLFMGLYFLYALVVPERYIVTFMAAFLAGYLCYDYIHYATHHMKMSGKIGQFLKKYHLKHHFKHENMKFGVSNPLWDLVFGTFGD
ncbi:MAG: fatty acid hydroxylase [Deltaproteobacteria bacterium]|nr:MAG: fatty acid hydroxylase [Deltaproteobacteria bacterium]